MNKKILILTASPRKGGNTDQMADAFIHGAQSSGHETFKFETAFHNIGGCNACNTCWSKGHACSVNDDFWQLEPLLESCDVLLIASPLYWFSFPAQIKGAIDRLYAYGGAGGDRDLAIKEAYLILCGGDTDKEEYQPPLAMYKGICSYLGWENKGILQTGGLDPEGALESSGVLKQAEDMGKNV